MSKKPIKTIKSNEDKNPDVSRDFGHITLTKRQHHIPILTFQGITYEVPTKDTPFEIKLKNNFKQATGREIPSDQWIGYKRILDDISGDVNEGEFLAIMGPSGAGKTTLADIIFSRGKKKVKSGTIRFMGKPLGPWMKPYIGYCKQEDVLFATETVGEIFTFAGTLRRRNDERPIKEAVEDVAGLVGLSHVLDSRVGSQAGQGLNAGAKTGLSGGERRRTSLAVEILAKPRLLMCDEPTTGLDQVSATKVVQLLRGLARGEYGHKVAVITTIHQPSQEIWNMFDRVMLLSKGKVFYFGTAAAVPFAFAKLGYNIPEDVNPADYMMKVATDTPEIDKEFPHEYHERYLIFPNASKEEWQKRLHSRLDSVQVEDERGGRPHSSNIMMKTPLKHEEESPMRLPYAAPYPTQFKMNLNRYIRQRLRDPTSSLVIFGQFIINALFAGTLFYKIPRTTSRLQDWAGVLYYSLTVVAFAATFSTSVMVMQNRVIYLREHAVSTYRTSSFVFSYFLILLVLEILWVVIYSSIMYFMVGLNTDSWRFIYFMLICFLTIFVSMSFGTAITTLFETYEVGQVLGMLILTVWLVLGGLFVNGDLVPGFYKAIALTSFMKWAYEALFVSSVEGLTFECTGLQAGGENCPLGWEDVLAQYGYQGRTISNTILKDCMILLGMGLLYIFIAYINTKYRRFG